MPHEAPVYLRLCVCALQVRIEEQLVWVDGSYVFSRFQAAGKTFALDEDGDGVCMGEQPRPRPCSLTDRCALPPALPPACGREKR